MPLKVDDLHVFTLVVAERSVSRTAARLFMTQQSVSERIRALERLVGEELFTRSSKGMEPTPAGYRLLPYAERCVSLVNEGFNMARAREEDVLRVQVHASSAPAAMAFLEATLAHHKAEISQHEGPVDDIVDAVAQGTADVAIGPVRQHPPYVAVRPFLSDPLVCVAVPTSSLAARREVRLADLAGHRVAVNIWGDTNEEHFTEVLLSDPRTSGDAPGVSLNGEAASTAHPPLAAGGAAQPATGGDTATICARSLVARQLDEGSLVEVAITDLPRWALQLHLIHRHTDTEREPIRALHQAISTGGGPDRGWPSNPNVIP